MGRKRKNTPVSTDVDPNEGGVVVQGAPVSEEFSSEVAGTPHQETFSQPLGLIPRDGNRAEAEEELTPVVQGLPPSASDEEHSPGKPGLPPEPEPEYDGLPYGASDDTFEADVEEEDEEITSFSVDDRTDLTLLEKRIDASTRVQAEALREIRIRQLWRLENDDQGNQRYANFDVYCQDRWGHSRQWVTHLTNWLRVVEEGERLGIPVPLTVKAAQGLLIGRLRAAGGLRAVLEEAKEDGVPLDRDHLREIVLRRADFNYWSKEGKAGSTRPAATTYAKYKKDVATVEQLGDGPTDSSLVGNAQQLDGDFPENLVALCQRERALPRAGQLLAVLTGRSLEEVVSRLTNLAREAAEIEEKKNRLETQRKEIKALEEKGGLKKLKEEARTLEKELEAKGVLPRKKKGPSQQEQVAGDGPATIPMTSVEARNEADEVADEDEGSEVHQSLAFALANLDEALAADWPADADELKAILTIAQECESKLAAITAKAKELVPDTEAPEGDA